MSADRPMLGRRTYLDTNVYIFAFERQPVPVQDLDVSQAPPDQAPEGQVVVRAYQRIPTLPLPPNPRSGAPSPRATVRQGSRPSSSPRSRSLHPSMPTPRRIIHRADFSYLSIKYKSTKISLRVGEAGRHCATFPCSCRLEAVICSASSAYRMSELENTFDG